VSALTPPSGSAAGGVYYLPREDVSGVDAAKLKELEAQLHDVARELQELNKRSERTYGAVHP
jgi:hypothetical protein